MARKGILGTTRRTGIGETVRLGLSIPVGLKDRLDKEAPTANWSAIITQIMTDMLDRNQHVQEALAVRLARLETEFAEHLRSCKG